MDSLQSSVIESNMQPADSLLRTPRGKLDCWREIVPGGMLKYHQHKINVTKEDSTLQVELRSFISFTYQMAHRRLALSAKSNTSRDVPLPREVSYMKSSAAPPRRETFRLDLKSQPFTLTLLRTESLGKARTNGEMSKEGKRQCLARLRPTEYGRIENRTYLLRERPLCW